jgi:hypothetical protein
MTASARHADYVFNRVYLTAVGSYSSGALIDHWIQVGADR